MKHDSCIRIGKLWRTKRLGGRTALFVETTSAPSKLGQKGSLILYKPWLFNDAWAHRRKWNRRGKIPVGRLKVGIGKKAGAVPHLLFPQTLLEISTQPAFGIFLVTSRNSAVVILPLKSGPFACQNRSLFLYFFFFSLSFSRWVIYLALVLTIDSFTCDILTQSRLTYTCLHHEAEAAHEAEHFAFLHLT